MAGELSWIFPQKEFSLLRLEKTFIALLAVVIFLISFQQAGSWFYAILATILFLGVYVLISAIVQKFRAVEEKYFLNSTHLQITRKTKSRVKKEKVALKDIKLHKLDQLFLGGYVLTHKGKRHQLFFSNKQEVEKFDQFVKKHLKPKRRKKK
ncbi:MAG: hypothetical protein KKH52_04675 [Nanoarchaeota archaeon]|nr:hypothetical protein [Nanoarchaeota archaeon]MBU1623121.1 hypothetical protein [Nanoarchaeota archaeon]MBU1974660.1 hypothetical protein [Nanoarchaeota archaeon]